MCVTIYALILHTYMHTVQLSLKLTLAIEQIRNTFCQDTSILFKWHNSLHYLYKGTQKPHVVNLQGLVLEIYQRYGAETKQIYLISLVHNGYTVGLFFAHKNYSK